MLASTSSQSFGLKVLSLPVLTSGEGRSSKTGLPTSAFWPCALAAGARSAAAETATAASADLRKVAKRCFIGGLLVFGELGNGSGDWPEKSSQLHRKFRQVFTWETRCIDDRG